MNSTPARNAPSSSGHAAVPGQAGSPHLPGPASPPGADTAGGGRTAQPLADAHPWGAGDPGSIYDYIRVATFAIGPDGRISQWSERAAEFFGVPAPDAVGADPITTFVPRELWQRGRARLERTLAGEEWVGTAPYRDAAAARASPSST